MVSGELKQKTQVEQQNVDQFQYEASRVPNTPRLKTSDREITVRVRIERPEVILLADVLAPDECDELISRAQEKLAPSTIVDKNTGELKMRKIRIFEHISLDGVIQAPGEPGEDGDYPYGGWTVPHADPVVGEVIVAAHREAFDLLLGRRTYDIWSGYWPKAGKSPLADSLNAATKYVATRTPDSLE